MGERTSGADACVHSAVRACTLYTTDGQLCIRIIVYHPLAGIGHGGGMFLFIYIDNFHPVHLFISGGTPPAVQPQEQDEIHVRKKNGGKAAKNKAYPQITGMIPREFPPVRMLVPVNQERDKQYQEKQKDEIA